ncbi:restriction endonuclease subunit S [Thiothrix lacustris]|uniref:restriction endonuclease subunit S n=1 Tax=Thiothrix lacustris TaxID=525917 RepID=UPI0004902354|nr:restriction endonuclease subunit S [Thiothrix lacustris]
MKWHSVPLEDLSVKRGGSVNPEKFPDETFELFSIPAFDTGKAEVCKGKEIGSAKKCVEPNDVLLSRIVPHIRRSWVVGESLGYRQIASGEWIQFRSDNVFPKYLKYFLISDPFHKLFMSTVSGVGGSLLRARPSEVYKIEIPLPPLPEQKRIAAILDAADALRTQRRQSIAELDLLLQSTFLEMFGDPVENPKGWEIESLGNLLTFITSGGRNWSKYYADSGDRFIRSLDVQTNFISNDSPAFVNAPNNAESRRTQVKHGDVLLTITGSRIGRVAPVSTDTDGAYISQHVALLRPSSMIDSAFLSFFLNSNNGQLQIAKSQYGQTKPGLSFEKIKKFSVPNIPIKLQQKFTNITKTVAAQKNY